MNGPTCDLFSEPDWTKAISTGAGVKLLLQTDATEYARRKKLVGVRVFLSKHLDETIEYVIFKGNEPVFAHQVYESIACRLDVMAFTAKGG